LSCQPLSDEQHFDPFVNVPKEYKLRSLPANLNLFLSGAESDDALQLRLRRLKLYFDDITCKLCGKYMVSPCIVAGHQGSACFACFKSSWEKKKAEAVWYHPIKAKDKTTSSTDIEITPDLLTVCEFSTQLLRRTHHYLKYGLFIDPENLADD
jgi:hypothetical protein